MDTQSSVIIYALLVIPTFFALTVTGQGIYKMTKQEADGPVALGVGVFLLVLIVVSYILFIR